ncbi:lipoprotein NlpI [compost metagenome]
MNSPQDSFPRTQQLSMQEAIRRAYAHWNAGQATEAEQLCRQVLLAWPYQFDAMHLLGLIAHAYGHLDVALAHVRQACQAAQAPAIYFSNYAEISRQRGLLAEAEQAARQAIQRRPELIEAWSNLGIILQESGKLEASLECLERVLQQMPTDARAHNNLANTCRRLNQLERAEQHYRQALALAPDYAEAYSNLAFLLNTHGKFDEAAAAAHRAIELQPTLIDAYLNLAEVDSSRLRHSAALQSLDKLDAFASKHAGSLTARALILKNMECYDAALACARQAVVLAPDYANAQHALAQVMQALGQYDEALQAYDKAALLPGAVAEDALLGRATLFMESGRSEEAIAAFEQVLEVFPGSIKALTARNDSKTYQAYDPDIAAMEAALAQAASLSLVDRIALHFALGKAYLDIQKSAQAFRHLDAGNRLKRATFSYDGAAIRLTMQRIAASFNADTMRELAGHAVATELPVFIIGMPRSGTTLVEQILASHPQVHGAGELSALRLAITAAGTFPEEVLALPPQALAAIGRDYLARVETLAKGKARLVDKMPANFQYAGLIPLILSGARIIHCRRDPVDTCLSCYSKHFAGEQLFSYDMTELGEFHRDYQILMSHLRQVLPADRFLEVDYEAVVDDLESQARRLIAFIGLPWDEACLQFHTTRRVVRTASVNQVRQPIYRTSKGRWQKHATYLGPLLAALGISA